MKKILIGIIMDGKAGGVDRYILNFFDVIKHEDVHVDFLTNHITASLQEKLAKDNAQLFEVATLTHPVQQYKQVFDLVKANGYDTVYFNVSTAITFPGVMAARKAGASRVLVHSHNSSFDSEQEIKRKIMITLHELSKPFICKYATEFYSCSDKAAQWLFTKKVMDSGRVQYVQNAIDTRNFSFSQEKRDKIRNELNIADKFVVGHVGNMLYQKNHFFLIDAFKKLSEMDSSAVLVLIGDGVRQEAIRERVKDLGLSDKVLMLGRINTADGYMSAFDVFALPSIFEGMPIVSVEAQCTKLPCVFSDTITRQAEISNMCKFVPIDDPKVFAQALYECKKLDRAQMVLTKSLDAFDFNNQRELFKQIANV